VLCVCLGILLRIRYDRYRFLRYTGTAVLLHCLPCFSTCVSAFDANVVEVRKEDVQEFLGALDDSLRKATPRFNATTTA
jgi:hypothetical protein